MRGRPLLSFPCSLFYILVYIYLTIHVATKAPTHLKDVSICDKLGLNLCDDPRSDEDELEDGEESSLKVGVGVSDHPKCTERKRADRVRG